MVMGDFSATAAIPELHSPPLPLEPLHSHEAAWALFQDGWDHMAKLRGQSQLLELEEPEFKTWLTQHPSHAQPLIVLGFALNRSQRLSAVTSPTYRVWMLESSAVTPGIRSCSTDADEPESRP